MKYTCIYSYGVYKKYQNVTYDNFLLEVFE